MAFLNMNTSVLSACASYIQIRIRMYLISLLVHANIAKELQVLKQNYINGNFGWFDDRP